MLQPDNNKHPRRHNFWTYLVGGSIPVFTILAPYLGVSTAAIIVYVIVVGLIFGTMLMWDNANEHATGHDWWDDDHSSGWRGF